MNTHVWDVAVIGGGPAGCSAAISLARRGLRVVLFESKTYPHDKLCGEFLSAECGGLLGDLGMGERLRALNPVNIHTVTLTAPDGSAWESRLPAPAMGLSRRVLDAALAEQAQQLGVTIREASTVKELFGNLTTGFELTIAGVKQTTTESARAVIAAHGKRAALDRALGRRFLSSRQPYVAIKAHYKGPPIPGRVELHAFPGGYCGLSEIEGGSKVVCLLVHEDTFRQHAGPGQEGIQHFIEWMKAQNLYLRAWLQWATRIHERWITIAQVPFTRKPAIERDVIMAGDSAGLIVPLAGNGISMALEGGMLAADHLACYLGGDLPLADLHHNYPAAWQRRFGNRLRLGRALQPVMMHTHTASLALRLINAVPSLGLALITHTRGPAAPSARLPF